MVLRLDPRVPRVWRTPSSLQFGVSRPVVVLADVTVAQEQMIAALVAGVTRRGLGMIGRTAGALDTEIDAFLELISPALSSVPSRMSGLMSGPESALTPMRRVVVAGSGRTAEATASLLDSAGYSVQLATQPATAERLECDLAVAVGQFVVHPDLHGLWLRRDIPHLSVVLADTRVTVGPVVHRDTRRASTAS